MSTDTFHYFIIFVIKLIVYVDFFQYDAVYVTRKLTVPGCKYLKARIVCDGEYTKANTVNLDFNDVVEILLRCLSTLQILLISKVMVMRETPPFYESTLNVTRDYLQWKYRFREEDYKHALRHTLL